MCALADDESTVIGAVGEEVDKTLETAEAGLQRILVLMSPRLIGLEVFAVREGQVDGVKADNKVFRLVDFFECADNAGLLADCPSPLLVCSACKISVSRSWKAIMASSPYPKTMPFSLITGR